MNPPSNAHHYWNATVERALKLYEMLWSEATEDALYSAWGADGSVASLVPYDSAEILVGVDAIGCHFQARRRARRLGHVSWRLLTSWNCGEGDCSIVRQRLVTVDRTSEREEARTHTVVVATMGKGMDMHLRHVSEATPAVLVEVRRSYERHAVSRDEL